MIESYFGNHNHTDLGTNSALGFPDTICRVPDLIQLAYDYGLSGIAITDHESISAHIQALKYHEKMKKDRPFALALGNEIYLMEESMDEVNKESHGTYPYYHFILTALDTEGHHQLRLLSTKAWKRAWKQGKIYRRATYYSDLEEIIKPNQGHVIASTACLGSRLDRLLLENDIDVADLEVERLVSIFGKGNLYIECQPPRDKDCDQWRVNEALRQTANYHGVKMIPTTDSHYLRKGDAYIHEIYLKSQEGEREVTDFYATAYLMSPDELREHLRLNFDDQWIDQMFEWSNEIADRIKGYDIFRNPIIPQIPMDKIPKFYTNHVFAEWYNEYPNFGYYSNKDRPIHERYFFYQIEQGLIEKIEAKGKPIEPYIARLDEEFEQFRLISEQLDTSIPSYFSSMSAIIDLIWEAGSLAMPGRGSAAVALTNYLLGVTQIDPVPLGEYFPFWRFMSIERGSELPD